MKYHSPEAIQDSIVQYVAARNQYRGQTHPIAAVKPHPLERQYLDILSLLKTPEAFALDTSRTGTKSRRLPLGATLTITFAGPSAYQQPDDRHTDPTLLPVFTHRRIWWRGALAEALWMWRGDTSLQRLDSLLPGASALWDNWAILDDNQAATSGPHVGRAYGYQFGQFLAPAIDKIKSSPDTRRAGFSLMQERDRPLMALECCHGCWIQFRSLPLGDNKQRLLYLDMDQRSADWLLGATLNILAYYLLLRVVSTYLNMEMGGIKYTFNDVHLYEDHIDQANEIYPRCTHRPPRLHFQPFPMLPREEGLAMWRAMDTRAAINALQMDWFTLDSALNYISLPNMKANVAV